MATEHLVKLAVTLTPVPGDAYPEIIISVPSQTIHTTLYSSQRFDLEFVSSKGWLKIKMINKLPVDHATAVIIEKIEFFRISDPKFIWQAQYKPEYPEPWRSQQYSPPPEQITNPDYLGWNGEWELEFEVPVFAWMHQILNLGWIRS